MKRLLRQFDALVERAKVLRGEEGDPDEKESPATTRQDRIKQIVRALRDRYGRKEPDSEDGLLPPEEYAGLAQNSEPSKGGLVGAPKMQSRPAVPHSVRVRNRLSNRVAGSVYWIDN